VTRTQSMTRTSGNATLASVTNTAGFGAGMPVEGPGIAVGCTIASLVANTSITLNSTSCVTASGSASISVFLTGYGSGGSSATVGVTDCRGSVLAGRDDLGTVPAGNLSNATATNSFQGSKTHAMLVSELAPHNHPVFLNDPGHSHGYTAYSGLHNDGTQALDTPVSPGTVQTSSNTTGITIRDASGGGGTANQTALTGSATPFSIVQPTRAMDCVQVVLP
jgi:hypothetical protein